MPHRAVRQRAVRRPIGPGRRGGALRGVPPDPGAYSGERPVSAAGRGGVGHVVIEADGGARGNPGPAGYGAVVRDARSGEVLAEQSESLRVATNNVAEDSGLIAGLPPAESLGAREVDGRRDSKLVIEQMSGRWQ